MQIIRLILKEQWSKCVIEHIRNLKNVLILNRAEQMHRCSAQSRRITNVNNKKARHFIQFLWKHFKYYWTKLD